MGQDIMEMVLIAVIVFILIMIVLYWISFAYKVGNFVFCRKETSGESVKQFTQTKKIKLQKVLTLDNSGYPIDEVVETVKNYRNYNK